MYLETMQLEVPASWEDRSMYTFIAPRMSAGLGPVAQDDGFRTNLVVNVGPRGGATSLADSARAAVSRVRESFGPLPIEEDAGPAIGGEPSRCLRYRIVEPGGTLPIAQVLFVSVVDRTERIFTFTTAAVHSKSLMREMEQMVGSVRLGGSERAVEPKGAKR